MKKRMISRFSDWRQSRFVSYFCLFVFFGGAQHGVRSQDAPKPEIRTFTRAADGKELEAFVVKHDGVKVTIQIAGNRKFEVEPSIFSEEDQKYISEWLLRSKGMPLPEELDSRLEPGSEFRVEVEGLNPTKQSKPGGFTVRIPEDYSYPQPIPLFVWINGGGAPENLSRPKELVDPSKWVLVTLPFPEEVSTESPIGADDLPLSNVFPIEKYHDALLGELERLIPNISPSHRMIGGTSNGAHTLGCSFHLGWESHMDRFNVFVLWEGGGGYQNVADYKKVARREKLIWVGEGAKGTNPNDNTFMKSVQRRMDESGVDITYEAIPSSGHGPNEDAMAAMKKWISETAIPHMDELDVASEE